MPNGFNPTSDSAMFAMQTNPQYQARQRAGMVGDLQRQFDNATISGLDPYRKMELQRQLQGAQGANQTWLMQQAGSAMRPNGAGSLGGRGAGFRPTQQYQQQQQYLQQLLASILGGGGMGGGRGGGQPPIG